MRDPRPLSDRAAELQIDIGDDEDGYTLERTLYDAGVLVKQGGVSHLVIMLVDDQSEDRVLLAGTPAGHLPAAFSLLGLLHQTTFDLHHDIACPEAIDEDDGGGEELESDPPQRTPKEEQRER